MVEQRRELAVRCSGQLQGLDDQLAGRGGRCGDLLKHDYEHAAALGSHTGNDAIMIGV